MTLFNGAQGVVRQLVIGRQSQADNRVSLSGSGARLTGSGRIDVGERNGRGTLEMLNLAEARPLQGVSVGIYDGSQGTLTIDRDAFLFTETGTVIVGGGASSQAIVNVRGGGSIDAADILLFARTSGSATVEVTGDLSVLEAATGVQVGFTDRVAGPALLRMVEGGRLAAGTDLILTNDLSLCLVCFCLVCFRLHAELGGSPTG